MRFWRIVGMLEESVYMSEIYCLEVKIVLVYKSENKLYYDKEFACQHVRNLL